MSELSARRRSARRLTSLIVKAPGTRVRVFYRTLHDHYGPQRWWPAKTAFEVVVGAYLTQNTSWKNVERALERLRSAGKLNAGGIRSLSPNGLGRLIRPSGYFRQKSRALKTFVGYLDTRHAGSLRRMFARHRNTTPGWRELRQQLLALRGVGEETADSILLYAGNLPVFVVDSYTRRIFRRHGITPPDASYREIQELVEKSLGTRNPTLRGEKPAIAHRNSAQRFNEMHALLVQVGKDYCFKTTPDCQHCPLARFLPNRRPLAEARHKPR